MEFHLAQINIAKMLAPIDSPVMAEFVANLDSINALAEGSDGFIWRLKTDDNNATSIKVYEDDFIIVNMSVWENMDKLHQFVYQSNHVEIFKQRKKWFEKMSDMHMALWYIPAGYIPTAMDGVERLSHLRNKGETPFAFSFKNSFTIEEWSKYDNSMKSVTDQ